MWGIPGRVWTPRPLPRQPTTTTNIHPHSPQREAGLCCDESPCATERRCANTAARSSAGVQERDPLLILSIAQRYPSSPFACKIFTWQKNTMPSTEATRLPCSNTTHTHTHTHKERERERETDTHTHTNTLTHTHRHKHTLCSFHCVQGAILIYRAQFIGMEMLALTSRVGGTFNGANLTCHNTGQSAGSKKITTAN